MSKTRVFIIDDSAVVRQVLAAVLDKDPQTEVIGVASDPIFAMEKMKSGWPDVIVLDIEMPRMDGITFLRKLMSERPTPVVICSSLTTKGAQTTIEALSAGAIGIVAKPAIGVRRGLMEDTADDLLQAVKAASRANMRCVTASRGAPAAAARQPFHEVDAPPVSRALTATTDRIVAIGTSTGGTMALEVVLTSLPRTCPGIVIVQHMPEKFTAMFAQRLDGICEIEVREAQNNDRVIPGRALIAPGGRHMRFKRSGAQYHVEVFDGPLVNRHRPSVDVLFRSVARDAGRNALGVIMTGMGDDGARGLKEMHDAGAMTLAQDEATCVVYGMPKEAVKLGGVDRALPLDTISGEIIRFGRGGP